MNNTIPVNLDYIKELRSIAEQNGTLNTWAGILMDWANGAEKEIQRLQKNQTCDHVIIDIRNKVIVSGYMCTKCNSCFAAGDH